MKFLNHLNINEHELRSAKLYRASSGTYTPAVSSAGNVILDTSAGIPKWWDGSAWRDFSFGTTGTMNWNIQSDGGSNIQVDQGDTLDLTGGNKITTATSGSASAPVVTINHDTQSQSNTTASAETIYDTSTWTTVSGVSVDAYGHVTGVETTAHTLDVTAYTIDVEDLTVGSFSGEVQVKLIGATPNSLSSFIVEGGTGIDVDVNGSGNLEITNTVTNTNTTFTLPTTNGANPDLVLTASTGGTDIVNMNGTANEVEVTGSGTNTLTFGLPDDVTIGNDLTVTTDLAVGGSAVITGNLTVNGTTTSVNSNTVNIGDNTIVLNSDETGTPSQNAGIEIERGTATNVNLLWNESTDKWTVSDGSNSYNIIQDLYKNFATDSGTATANSVTDTLTLAGSGGISTSRSGDTITITAAGSLGQQNLYATFIGDSGTTTANSATDTLDIEGGTGITTTASTDKVTVAFDADNSGLNIFKNVRPRNTNNAGTVSNGTSAVADAITDTLDIKSLDESIVLAGGDDFISIKGAVKTVAVNIDVSSLSSEKQAHINHGFGTKDLIVQLWQTTASGKNENVMASIQTINSSGNASTNDITITFDYVGTSTDISDGDADIRCIIMAVNHATAAGATVTYS
tara:strand:+ start:1217 stop:3100 length:1884 start_codon:yes stop_codon:yes gene_type:complete